MTREAVNKLSDTHRAYLENIVYVANYATNIYLEKEKIRCKIVGYCQCLKDSGILTEYERRAVCIYYRGLINFEGR